MKTIRSCMQARSQDFQKGGYIDVCMYVCISMQDLGGREACSPGSSYMARRVLHPIFSCPYVLGDNEFPREKVLRNIPCLSIHFQKGGMTLGCSVATSLLAVTHYKDDW